MDKKELLHLEVTKTATGRSICLEEKEIHHVEKYSIEEGPVAGTAKLSVEILVRFP